MIEPYFVTSPLHKPIFTFACIQTRTWPWRQPLVSHDFVPSRCCQSANNRGCWTNIAFRLSMLVAYSVSYLSGQTYEFQPFFPLLVPSPRRSIAIQYFLLHFRRYHLESNLAGWHYLPIILTLKLLNSWGKNHCSHYLISIDGAKLTARYYSCNIAIIYVTIIT